MASAIFLFILLSGFLTVAVTGQLRSSNISIGSSLSPTANTTSWLSSSGRFAFGFYPEGNGFAVGIWLDRIPQKTLVWTANQVDPKVPSNVTLLLTTNGGLTLRTAQGQDSSISDNTGQAFSASMLDTGNFVLYNSKSEIIWQSFDSPTNTILQGQRLIAGGQLFSSISETDNSMGRFELIMQRDGNLVQYPVEVPNTGQYAYYSSRTDGAGDNVTLNLDDDGKLYLLNGTGFNIRTVLSLESKLPTNATLFFRMTIDVDGIFRLYSHNLDRNSNWSIEAQSTTNRCDPKGYCGLNGYCTLIDQDPVCRCLPGFRFINQDETIQGCEREENVENCESKKGQFDYRMSSLENTEWEDSTYIAITSNTKEECGDACLRDCNCEVAIFEDQRCKKQKLPLRYGRRTLDGSRTAFVKVGATPKNNNSTELAKVTEEEKKDLPKYILIAGVTFVACAFFFLGIFSILFCRYRALAYQKLSEQQNIGLTEEMSLQSFTYDELQKATDGFKEVVGRGSFGTVFKGASANGQRLIAVKRLEKVVEEGEREFRTEMRAIGRTHHKNLVQLLGYCHEGSNRLLVYEYMSNGSLADFLFKEQRPNWNDRVETALNIARGILYLHEECGTQIIHCDIKPQNILIDEYGCAKIADFGLAKLLKRDQTKTFTGIRGTRGYVAPEWHRNMPITVKADVYSFGIVLLEIICCRKSLDMELPEVEVVLVDWVYQCFHMGELVRVTDNKEVDMRRFERMVRVALWSIQDEPSLRPSMKKVVLMLEGTIDIPIPPSPNSFLSSI